MDTNMPLLQVDEDIILKILELDDAEALFNLINQNRVHLREWLPWVDANIALENTQLFIQ
jgi:ribosomal-protein-serine acetyltransferase